jgi:hypothetical protein
VKNTDANLIAVMPDIGANAITVTGGHFPISRITPQPPRRPLGASDFLAAIARRLVGAVTPRKRGRKPAGVEAEG